MVLKTRNIKYKFFLNISKKTLFYRLYVIVRMKKIIQVHDEFVFDVRPAELEIFNLLFIQA